MNSSDRNGRNIDEWLSQELDLATRDRERVAGLVEEEMRRLGYKRLERSEANHLIEVRGQFGTKLRALIVGLLPFGKHTPWGKRIQLRATIRNTGSRMKVDLKATPFMELFDESEVIILSQTIAEKASDEYLAAVHLHRIAETLRGPTKMQENHTVEHLPPRAFAADFVSGLLLYFLEGDATKKVVHIPPSFKGRLRWGALVMPAIWFIWREIWGVGILVLSLQWLLWKVVITWPVFAVYVSAACLLVVLRVTLAYWADWIYYARYGRWPNEGRQNQN